MGEVSNSQVFMSGIPILITGATGYIGAQLLLALIRRFGAGVQCRVLVRQESDTTFLRGLPVEIVTADLHEPVAVIEAIRGSEVVFHCAGLIAYTYSYRRRLYETNVLGTRNVVNACLSTGVHRLVVTSSIAAVGADEGAGGIFEANEALSFNEWQRRNVYMESKYLAELECLRGAAEGLDVVMVNPGVVIGRGDGEKVPGSSSNEVLQAIYRGLLSVCPDGGTGFVDVRDVAEAHIEAWQKGRAGERYIIVAGNLSFRELFERIGRMPGSRVKRAFSIPAPAGTALGLGGELWSLITGRPTFISLESIKQASRSIVYSNLRSVSELGMEYRQLEATLESVFN